MKFGKREQIVVISLLGIGTIAFLHLMVFSPRAARYKEAIAKKKGAEAVKNIQTPKNPGEINKLKDLTAALELEYNDLYTSLSVVHPAVFEVPVTPDDVKPEDMDPKLDPKKLPPPQELKKLKAEQFPKIRWNRRAPQIELIYEQMRKLQEFDTRTGGKKAGKAAGKGEILFLANPDVHRGGWAYPAELNKGVTGGKLDDIVSHIDQTTQLLGMVQRESKALWDEQRQAYEAALALLGIDLSIFKDFSPAAKTARGMDYGGLAAKGEYIPLLVKMRWAMLLEDALMESAREAVRAAGGDPATATLADKRVSNEPVSRERIFKWLEINPPYDPLPAALIRDAEVYYLYLQLYYLNYLLDTMLKPEHAVADIYVVTFDEIMFQKSFVTVANPEPAMPDTKPKEPRKNYYAIAPPEEGVPINAPFEAAAPGGEDLAYAIRINVVYRILNRNAWILAYDIIRDNPLASIDRMEMIGGAAGDVFVDASYVFVPQFTEGTNTKPKVFVPTPAPTPPPTPAPRGTPAAAAATPAAPAAPGAAATPASRLGPAPAAAASPAAPPAASAPPAGAPPAAAPPAAAPAAR